MRATTLLTGITCCAFLIAGGTCDIDLFEDYCELYGPVGGDGPTTVEVYNSADDTVRATIVPIGAVNPCAERDLPGPSALADEAFAYGGVSVALVLGSGGTPSSLEELIETPAVGETSGRSLDCNRVGHSVIFGPTIWLDTENRRVLALAGPIVFYRQRGNDLDLSRVYQCGDRLQLEVDEDFTATALVIRNDAAVTTRDVVGVPVKQECMPGNPIVPGGTTLLLTWSVREPFGFDDRTYQIFEFGGKFYLGRIDRLFVTPFAPSLSVLFGPDPKVELTTDAVQDLVATLEENCIYDLPSDLTGGYFYRGDDRGAGRRWYVAATRGLLQNELFIDQTALELDGRYEAIAGALTDFVTDNAGG